MRAAVIRMLVWSVIVITGLFVIHRIFNNDSYTCAYRESSWFLLEDVRIQSKDIPPNLRIDVGGNIGDIFDPSSDLAVYQVSFDYAHRLKYDEVRRVNQIWHIYGEIFDLLDYISVSNFSDKPAFVIGDPQAALTGISVIVPVPPHEARLFATASLFPSYKAFQHYGDRRDDGPRPEGIRPPSQFIEMSLASEGNTYSIQLEFIYSLNPDYSFGSTDQRTRECTREQANLQSERRFQIPTMVFIPLGAGLILVGIMAEVMFRMRQQ